jgi:hypothetical protein
MKNRGGSCVVKPKPKIDTARKPRSRKARDLGHPRSFRVQNFQEESRAGAGDAGHPPRNPTLAQRTRKDGAPGTRLGSAARSLRNNDLEVKSLFFFHLGTVRHRLELPPDVGPTFRPDQKVKLDKSEAGRGGLCPP